MNAQSIDISGNVVEAFTNEPIVYALVALGDSDGGVQQGGYTDEEGFFYFKITNGDLNEKWRLHVQYPGMRDTTILLDAETSNLESLRITLRNDLSLPVINVKAASKGNGFSSSVLSPSVEALKKVPALFGEVDVVKSLVLLPGISAGIEGTSNIQIRGGNPSQTDTRLDGISLYHAGHLGGFLSSVDPFGVKGITVYKGGIPSRFGGRLSGVLDIDLRDGRRDQANNEISIGTATVRAGREGPIGKKGTYLASGRYSYPSLIVNAFGIGKFKKGVTGNKTVASMYDLTFKTVRKEDRSQFSASVFVSGDQGTVQTATTRSALLDEYRWGTVAAALNHRTSLASDLQLENQLSYARYGYAFEASSFIREDEASVLLDKMDQSTALTDGTFNTNLSWFKSNNLIFRFGTELIAHRFKTNARATDGIVTDSTVLDENQENWRYAIYGQMDYRSPNERLNLMAGLRASGMSGFGPVFYPEPRLRFSYSPVDKFYVNAGYDWNTQFVHQLTTSLSLFPSDIWILGDAAFRPSRSKQIYGGLAFQSGNHHLSVEVFTKQMSDLIRLNAEQRNFLAFNVDWQNTVATAGLGRVRGLEFYYKKTGARLDLQVAYTLSKSERRYAEINDDQWFPYIFDRTHDGALTLQYTLTNGWSMGANFVYQTGYAVTFPIATSAEFFIFDEINNARLPAYHRADVSFSRSYSGKKRPEVNHRLTLGIYNLYNRQNAVDFRVEPTSDTSIDPATGQEVLTEGFRVVQTNLFPFIPSVSYARKF